MSDKKRFVPHEHLCYVCGKLEGCEDEACEQPRTPWVCAQKSCRTLAKSGVVHLMGANSKVPMACCGLKPSETPRQDRMVGDPEKVTCKGKVATATGATAAGATVEQ